MSEYSSPAYFFALSLANVGSVWFAGVLGYSVCYRPRMLLPHVAAGIAFVYYLADFYAILPVLWWPDSEPHAQAAFAGFALSLFASISAQLLVSLIFRVKKVLQENRQAKENAS